MNPTVGSITQWIRAIGILNLTSGFVLVVLGLANLAATDYLWTDSMILGSVSGNAFMRLVAAISIAIGSTLIIIGMMTLMGRRRGLWPMTLIAGGLTIGITSITIDAINQSGILSLVLSSIVLACLFKSEVKDYFTNPSSTLLKGI